MDIERADEIVKSLGYINVTYNNKPVWIERINPEEQTVVIKYVDNETTIIVNADRLNEQHTEIT
jgi:small acid-soluble spore protein, H-type